jgi:hypothetical protein
MVEQLARILMASHFTQHLKDFILNFNFDSLLRCVLSAVLCDFYCSLGWLWYLMALRLKDFCS